MEHGTWNKLKFFGIDISGKALRIARQNAKLHKVNKKIKFLKGDLLEPVIKNCFMFHVPCSMIILANLPYLSQKIYSKVLPDIKKYEPKSALLSSNDGLAHYEKLLKLIKKLKTAYRLPLTTCFFEISPEQKLEITKTIKSYFPKIKPVFYKDLAGKWRVCRISF